MPTTKYKISETVLRRLSGGNIKLATKVTIPEIAIAVEQLANKALKMEYLQTDLPLGNIIPNGASIATYEDVLVTQYKNVSQSILPAMPIKLPHGIGLWQIFRSDDVNNQFIPVDNAAEFLIIGQPVLSDLSGCVAFTQYGDRVQYTRDLTTPNVTTTVTVRLIVLDISQYSDWDLLPIPPDMEADIVNQAYAMFANEPVANKLDDPGRAQQIGIPVTKQTQD